MTGVFNSCDVINDINTQTVLCSIKVVQLEFFFLFFHLCPLQRLKNEE